MRRRTVTIFAPTLKPEVADPATVIALYREHATSEQFHSEFKTDLDLERLPSGKFDTNDLLAHAKSSSKGITYPLR